MSAEALAFGLSLARAQVALQRQLEERLAEWHGLDMAAAGAGARGPDPSPAGQGAAVQTGGRVRLRAAGHSLQGEARQTAGTICDKALQALRLEPVALAACQQVLECLSAWPRGAQ